MNHHIKSVHLFGPGLNLWRSTLGPHLAHFGDVALCGTGGTLGLLHLLLALRLGLLVLGLLEGC